MRLLAKLVLSRFALVLSSVAALDTSALTVQEFASEIVESSPVIREQLHVYRQAVQDEAVALSGWRPSIDLTASLAGVSRSAGNTNQRRTEYDRSQAAITLTQNIFDGFDTENEVAQARARITAAAFRLIDTADNEVLEGIQAYLAVLEQRRLVELASQNVASHERILGKIRELGEQGIVRRSDVEQTEGRLARAQASLIAQQNNLEDALTTVHRLLGRHVVADSLGDPQAPDLPAGSVEELTEIALGQHPALAAARMNIAAARAAHRRSRSANLPSLDLQVEQLVGNSIDGPSGRTQEGSIMFNLRYNLYRGGADSAEQRKRVSVIQENKSFLDRVRRQIVDTLRLAHTADRALRAQLPFLKQHAEKSLETLDLYREEYLLFRRDLIDVLDAEGELNRALIGEAEAVFDLLGAQYRVHEGMGQLFDALGIAVQIDERSVRIAKLDASGLDSEVLARDVDSDGRADELDQCDNSTNGVNRFGCIRQPRLELGYAAVEQVFEAEADAFTYPGTAPFVITRTALLANDRVGRADRPEILSVGAPVHGTAELDDDGNIVYTPVADYAGEDTFEYKIRDRRGRQSSALVTVTIGPLPVVRADGETHQLRFHYKKNSLTKASAGLFEFIVRRLEADPALEIRIATHTDNVGSRAYNRRLSTRRAAALKRKFIGRGIASARIDVVGRGESQPIADNGTEAGRALNRRAEVTIVDRTTR